jgi:hypothetical protein
MPRYINKGSVFTGGAVVACHLTNERPGFWSHLVKKNQSNAVSEWQRVGIMNFSPVVTHPTLTAGLVS